VKISIFKQAKAHPKGKDEKIEESFKCSSPYEPETVVVTDDLHLQKLVTTYAWSPSIFDGVRRDENFISCDFLVYDIDEGLTIDEADAIIQQNGFACLCLPSPSHTEENHRFRIILPLEHTIFELDTFHATSQAGAKLFKTVDPQCSDGARFYFGSTTKDGFWQEGELFKPVKKPTKTDKGTSSAFSPSQTLMLDVDATTEQLVEQIYGKKRDKVPEAIDYFLRNAHTGIPGGWICALNSFCFSLSLTGIEDDVIMSICEQLAPDELDRRDLDQIKRAIRDGKKQSEV
jgi:hypothetical protein